MNTLAARELAILLSFGLILCAPGCSRKASVDRDLDRAVAALQQPGLPEAPPATAPAPATPVQSPAQPAPAAPDVGETPKAQMAQALAAYKSGNLEDAVARFQRLRTITSLTPQQRMAVQDAVAAVMNDVYALADKGNPRAVQALKEYNEARHARPSQ
jgi:hypothetical protein